MASSSSVFISHTSDMAAFPAGSSFVRAAVDAVLKAGLHPVDMEQFAAREDVPGAYCERRIRECDIYLAVVGFRYGSLVPDRTDPISYTELEFLTATEAGMPRLVFVLGENAAVPRSLVDRDSTAIDRFRQRLHDARVIVKAVADPTELAEAVLQALYENRLDRLGRNGGGDPAGRPGASARGQRPWMAPPLDRIVERPELADQVLMALTAPASAGAAPTVGLLGAGGFGKTTLATWACNRTEIEQRFPGGLLWVTVGQETRDSGLAERINDLGFLLSGRKSAISNPDVAGAELGRLLDERGAVLLVIDDVWETTQLRSFRFGGSACTRLVTTRVPDVLPDVGQRIFVESMTAVQARELVAYGIDGLPIEAPDRLASVAGRWPVLLNLVNGALRRRVFRGQSPDEAAEGVLALLTARGPAALDPYHLRNAGMSRELCNLVCDLRWAEAKVRHLGSVVDVQADLASVDIPVARLLGQELRHVAHILGPTTPHEAFGTTLASRLHSVPGLETILDRYRSTLPLPRLEPAWPLPDRSEASSSAGHSGDLSSSTFSPDGSLLATTSQDHTARLWHTADGTQFAVLSGHTSMVWDSAFSMDGSVLATASDDWTVRLWNVADGTPLALLAGHTGGVHSCMFSPDRHHLATVSDDSTARLWKLADGSYPAVILRGHAGRVTGCAFSPDGTLLATCGEDDTARIWDISRGSEVRVLAGRAGGIRHCAISPDGTLLATGGEDGLVRLWRVSDGTLFGELVGHTDRIERCAFSPDGLLLAAGGGDGTARVWRLSGGVQEAVLNCHPAWVSCSFSPDGALLATTGHDQSARLWTVPDYAPHATLSSPGSYVNDCSFSPDGKLLATAGPDRGVQLWHMPDNERPKTLVGHTDRVTACTFSPDSATLATVGDDHTVRLWTVPEGSEPITLTGHTDRTRGCAFSPDGTLLATVGDDQTVRLWQLPEGTPTATLTGYAARLTDCAFSPDGALLAIACLDGTVQLRRANDGTLVTALTGNLDPVNSCVFSPDGLLLATAGEDRTVRLWKTSDGTPVAVLTGHAGWVNGCTFSPDGTYLATVSHGTIRIWHVASGECQCALGVVGPLTKKAGTPRVP